MHDSPTSTRPEALGNGRYRLEQPLGIGGMAAVYSVFDTVDQTQRALKLLLPHNASHSTTRKRFIAEAQTMARLDHPNIVRIYDVGQEGEHWYFVMELVSDGNVATWLRRNGRAAPRQATRYMIQALRGLHHAHVSGIVHRDVKPHNMLLSGDRLLLTDFGIARELDSEGGRLTGTGDTLGTLAYMAPEQRMDARKVGPAADIYAVSATLYILLTGRRPFDLAMLDADPAVLGRVPEPLRPVIARAAAAAPEQRYPSAAEMADALQAVLEALPADPETQRG